MPHKNKVHCIIMLRVVILVAFSRLAVRFISGWNEGWHGSRELNLGNHGIYISGREPDPNNNHILATTPQTMRDIIRAFVVVGLMSRSSGLQSSQWCGSQNGKGCLYNKNGQQATYAGQATCCEDNTYMFCTSGSIIEIYTCPSGTTCNNVNNYQGPCFQN